MSEAALPRLIEPAACKGPDLTGASDPIIAVLVGGMIAAVPLSVIYSICFDIDAAGEEVKSDAPFLLVFVSPPTALGFEFANGFHAVATVAHTRSLAATFEMVWLVPSSVAGVLASSDAVASAMTSSLPVERVLQVGTRPFGLPASSSNSRFERLAPWQRALQPLRKRTAKWPADLEH